MARRNVPVKQPKIYTHEGGKAQHINPEQQLRRSVMSCMLWEDEFYEDGKTIASRVAELVPRVKPEVVAQIAIDAREKMYLRHMPLLLVREMARSNGHRPFVASTLDRVIQRADELAEFLAIYWADYRQPLSAQVKKGLASAFTKFDEYQLKKYNRDNAIKLRDVLFLCHAKPRDKAQEALWKRLIDDNLKQAKTWEEELSKGTGKKTEEDKKAVWEMQLRSGKLGDFALLRNLRNMHEAGVNEALIGEAMRKGRFRKVLPFRFIAAAQTNKWYEPLIEEAMLRKMQGYTKLPGYTVLLVDVSGSMDAHLSARSDLQRIDAACALAAFMREVCEKVDVFTFSEDLVQVPARRGFALIDACNNSQRHSGTYLGHAINAIYAPKGRRVSYEEYGWGFRRESSHKGLGLQPDRLVTITDEQAHDEVKLPKGMKGYMLNVASNANGVGYGNWLHIDGWSEAVIDYIVELETHELY